MTTTHPFGDEHVRVYRESGGEEGYLWKRGTEILILTTKGRKSGELRDNPLIFREIGGKYVIIASKGGSDSPPAWWVNLRANPADVEIQVKADRFKVRWREAQGDEREQLWKAMTEVWPDYDEYQSKTDRRIPVVVLEKA
jgi:deazaflavin-dependent oxidoreductase (nitroreductase family)